MRATDPGVVQGGSERPDEEIARPRRSLTRPVAGALAFGCLRRTKKELPLAHSGDNSGWSATPHTNQTGAHSA